ncbi:hypothetical protein L1887_19053 [Cichorium endivia]|nr:hypothetical protein L1887_19053 [Cichorium endivia]
MYRKDTKLQNHTFAYLRVELGDFAAFIATDILLEYVIGGAVVASSWTSHFVTLCNYKPKDFWITTHGLTKNYNELDPIIIVVLSAKGFSLINYIASVIHIIVILFIIICSLINADTKKDCETLPYEACGIFEAFIVFFCKRNTLDSKLIKGKIVVCMLETLFDDRKEKAIAIKEGGGAGMILVDPLGKEVLFQSIIRSVLIGQEEAQELQSYMNTEKNATARIYPTVTDVGIKPAPVMAIFSSKGPNIITPDIIKPDITAPGVNILAAWSPLATENTAGNSLDYNIISGTSMSCPHVSAVVALLKSVHPNWSPAMIRSAIMTTATITDNTGNLIKRDDSTTATPSDYGSGHINPGAAVDPGLVYNFDTNDLINYLCSSGASLAQLKNLTGTPVCKNPPTSSYNFNYPSIGVANLTGNMSVYRTVTYIGEGPTVYYSKLEITGVKASVYPNVLRFGKWGEKMTYRIDFVAYESSNGSFEFGSLTWTNNLHTVRSPIAVNVVSV